MSMPLTHSKETNFLSATLLFSLMLHGILILGITFHFVKNKPSLPTLDVTLVNVANQVAPKHADYLAQSNNTGGGQSEHSARPSRMFTGPLPDIANGTAPRLITSADPRPQLATPNHLLTTRGHSDFNVDSDSAQKAQQPHVVNNAAQARQQQEIARLAAELREETEAYAKRPKKKFISANTKEYVYATYMRYWVDQVERMGNLNYPEQARQQNLHGELILTVGINRDGSIHNMAIIKSSGQPILDRAAERIVKLAAPFPPLPNDHQHIDELYITRTWQFLPGNVLRHQ